MKTEQYIITDSLLQGNIGAQGDLVLLFGATKRIKEKGLINMIRSVYTKKWKGYATSWEQALLIQGFIPMARSHPFPRAAHTNFTTRL